MNKFKLLICVMALFTMISARAGTLIFAGEGTEFEYTVYQRAVAESQYSKTDRATITTYIEFTETSDNEKSRASLLLESSLEITKDDGKNLSGFYNVIQRSTIEQIGQAGNRNEPDLYFLKMKTGTVKFFNDAKGFRLMKEALSDTDETKLLLPLQVSKEIDEALTKSDKVIIIFRTFEVQEGKKGLNAVNVKKV